MVMLAELDEESLEKAVAANKLVGWTPDWSSRPVAAPIAVVPHQYFNFLWKG